MNISKFYITLIFSGLVSFANANAEGIKLELKSTLEVQQELSNFGDSVKVFEGTTRDSQKILFSDSSQSRLSTGEATQDSIFKKSEVFFANRKIPFQQEFFILRTNVLKKSIQSKMGKEFKVFRELEVHVLEKNHECPVNRVEVFREVGSEKVGIREHHFVGSDLCEKYSALSFDNFYKNFAEDILKFVRTGERRLHAATEQKNRAHP